MKPVNVATSSEFHEWCRRALPRNLVIQDLDAWALAISETGEYRIAALMELKRSGIAVGAWRPFAADRRNYAALLNLARAAGVPLYVVYFQKGVPIEDATPLHVFRLDAAVPEYHGRRMVIRARDFARRFPALMSER